MRARGTVTKRTQDLNALMCSPTVHDIWSKKESMRWDPSKTTRYPFHFETLALRHT
ncbi:unnamed protein product [Periconia digitata]|uniref:Uncharacterized protein n=1 Tax=Periconia digitata TaxID=1303443 RepID=A0A9W4UBJ1_9PLEO|nr:unnamed protein product [Periconia digitata]